MRIRPIFLAFSFALSCALPALAAETEDEATATQTLSQPEAEPTSFAATYTSAAQDLVNQGMNYLGISYRLGGTSPETGLDCSGLVRSVFSKALGLDLPRTAREMAAKGQKVDRDDLKPGDLVFFNTMRRAFSHVGIYVGDGQFLHAPSSGGRVRIEDMSQRYWAKRFNGARRVVDDNESLAAPD